MFCFETKREGRWEGTLVRYIREKERVEDRETERERESILPAGSLAIRFVLLWYGEGGQVGGYTGAPEVGVLHQPAVIHMSRTF